MYAAAGALATTTERGTWVAPANRVTWTPPGFDHSHRFYGRTDARLVVIPAEPCDALVAHPSVFAVSPLLREALLALTDPALLTGYSETCLRHVWNYQAYATWITELIHNAGDASHEGEFRKQIARAELERQFNSPTANRLFGELAAGVNEDPGRMGTRGEGGWPSGYRDADGSGADVPASV